MREIKFRAKRLDNGEWATGDLVTEINPYDGCVIHAYIHNRLSHVSGPGYPLGSIMVIVDVDPKTVCQFTSRKIEDTEICEGDLIYITIFDCFGGDKQYTCRVEWWGSAFWLISLKNEKDRWDLDWALSQDDEPEIRGNIHENPELVK